MKTTPQVVTLLTCARRLARPKKSLICTTTPQMHSGAKVVLPENLLLDCSHIYCLSKKSIEKTSNRQNLFGLNGILNLRGNSF